MKRPVLLSVIVPALCLVLFFSLESCSTVQPVRTHSDDEFPHGSADGHSTSTSSDSTLHIQLEPLVMTFAGDIMAHNVNYNMREYDRIYDDLREWLFEDHLTFGNFEMPVADSIPMASYPRFNVHFPYLLAAARGGFDVFSLANNHSNDHGIAAMDETRSAFRTLETGYGLQGRRIASNGLRSRDDEAMQPVLIESNGWRVLFLSITEILNIHDSSRHRVYYVPAGTRSRAEFRARISAWREEYNPDLFILSIHLDEPEYVISVSQTKRDWFSSLSAAGVDIVWGHHPHVMQKWEQSPDGSALFMYSMGNFISGQRWNPKPEDPDHYREYTGDAVLLRVTAQQVPGVKRKETGTHGLRFTVEPVSVTNWRDPVHGMVVRRFTEDFIAERTPFWQTYYRFRYAALARYLDIPPLPVSSPTAIVE